MELETKDEKSLIRYLEVCMVDYSGRVDTRHMNEGDFEIVKKWHATGFIRFYRLPFAIIEELQKMGIKETYQLVFSPEAWEAAEISRREISDKRVFSALQNGLRTEWLPGGS